MMDLICGAEKRACALHRASKNHSTNVLTVKKGTAKYAETDNFELSMRHIFDFRSSSLHSLHVVLSFSRNFYHESLTHLTESGHENCFPRLRSIKNI